MNIALHPDDKKTVLKLWDNILVSNRWTEGEYTERFEDAWAEWNGLPAVAFSSWSGAALCAMEYFGIGRKHPYLNALSTVACPTNTFIATSRVISNSGAIPIFCDSSRDDLCLSRQTLHEANYGHHLHGVWLVHIGGHIAFDSQAIADYCAEREIILLEDCAHAHGASWNGKKPGTWGDAGIWSFYATKTISTGEGGMLVSKHPDLIEYAREYRNYGKPGYHFPGLNYRMNEFTAALGLVQTKRLPEIIARKNEIAQQLDEQFSNRVRLPEGMVSGYYKYIVFDPIENSTGKVYDRLCHEIMGENGAYPHAKWLSKNHWCVPLYY